VQNIFFKSLIAKNFLSVGDNGIVIDFQKGITVITGTNKDKEDSKNGVGKSTIVDALHFALFGSTIRTLNKDLISNSLTGKKCEVTIIFDIVKNNITSTYKLTRTLSPSKCILEKNNEDVTLSTIQKTNEYIQQLLRTTEGVFQNSVIMSIGSTVPFMAQSKIDKRKFIENILNLEVFSKMLSLIREEYNTFKKDYEITFNKKQNLQTTLESYNTQLKYFEANKQQKIEAIEQKHKKNEQDIALLFTQVKNIDSKEYNTIEEKRNKILEELCKYELKLKEEDNKKIEYNTLIKAQEKRINELKEKNAVCPTCKRPFSVTDEHSIDEHVNICLQEIENLQKQKQLIVESYNTVYNSVKLLKQGVDTLDSKKEQLKAVETRNENINTKVKLLQELLVQCLNEINTLKLETNTHLEQVITTTTKEYQELESTLTTLNTKLKVYECAKFITSEEGVKSFIVKKILTLLNSRISYYLQRLQANCQCTFNEFFEDSIQSDNGSIRSYFNFSGGERKRIDLACLFAFLDIRRLQGDVNYSVIFYDELFDSALDDVGMECVFSILRERQELYSENSFIITHRGKEFINRADNIIMLEKRNGITYLLE
jgi:DNA repair exonuclease SbcCD ATPase subunit